MRLTKQPVFIAYIVGLLILLVAFPVAYAYIIPQDANDDIPDSPYLRIDPEKIVLSDRDDRVPCGECHTLEYDAWQDTPHSKGFDTMHRSKSAQGILERMDFRLAKRESLCLRCHYTATDQSGTAKAIAGVSCESCHGAARDWETVHNDYGGFTHETEPAEHAEQRAAASEAGGMLRPSNNLYGVAANCFECHTVPSERLVDVGKHASGSDFELIEWSENIRHNFIQAQWSNDESNRPPSTERKRLMYVIGRLLDYEYSIRGLAESTTTGRYFKAMERRVTSAVRELEKIAVISSIPQVDEVLKNHKSVKLVPDSKESLLTVADQVRTLGQEFTMNTTGANLEPVDRLIAGENINIPSPEPVETPPEQGGPANDPAPSAEPGDSPAPSPTPSFQVVGAKNTVPKWFPSSQYDVTLANCARCHIQADEWLVEDRHYTSTRALHNESPEAVRIASNYGLTRAQMKQGNQICMQCHGTVATGQEASTIFDGVTCESCHGPSSGYERPHRNDRAQGFSLGMVELKNANVLAGNCARCHHITDERLISSGHPDGSGYNIADGLTVIKHWPDDENIERSGSYPEVDANAVRTAFASNVASRPVPQVPIAPRQQQTPTTASRPSTTPSTGSRQTRTQPRASSTPPQPPPNRPARSIPRPSTSGQQIDLPPYPAVSDSTSTEDMLLIVKERLELLYKALGRNE